MEWINYNGAEGVFITNGEFDYIKLCIKNNNLLMIALIDLIADNPFDYILHRKKIREKI